VKTNKTIEVNGYKYEELSHKVDDFNNLGGAIVKKNCITFVYSDKLREVNPYKLINTNGIWYLVGVEEGVLKNFSFSKVDTLKVIEKTFKEDTLIIKTLKEHSGVWFAQNCLEVEVLVDSSVAHYFLRRDLLPNQKFVEHTDEHLILSTQVAYEEEILKIVRYWIPHIQITFPIYLQEKLEKKLKYYLSL
jgi:predicted DNA-binding transcriptional regulator YafY